jgi:hypothetical protein
MSVWRPRRVYLYPSRPRVKPPQTGERGPGSPGAGRGGGRDDYALAVRLAFDGLPRDLPLSHAERRALRSKVHAWRPQREPRSIWIAALLPGTASLLMMLVWVVALWLLHDRWLWVIIPLAPLAQVWFTFRLIDSVLWPYTCRAMAAVGYEVCPRCAFPRRGAPTATSVCPRCGAARLLWW